MPTNQQVWASTLNGARSRQSIPSQPMPRRSKAIRSKAVRPTSTQPIATQSMSTVFASGYRCSRVPGSIRALVMKVSTSCSCSRMTRPNLYAGNCPSSMNLYKVRSDTPRRLAASLVDSQRRSEEAMPVIVPDPNRTMRNFHDVSLHFVIGHHRER
jgi:hypothetical protein